MFTADWSWNISNILPPVNWTDRGLLNNKITIYKITMRNKMRNKQGWETEM